MAAWGIQACLTLSLLTSGQDLPERCGVGLLQSERVADLNTWVEVGLVEKAEVWQRTGSSCCRADRVWVCPLKILELEDAVPRVVDCVVEEASSGRQSDGGGCVSSADEGVGGCLGFTSTQSHAEAFVFVAPWDFELPWGKWMERPGQEGCSGRGERGGTTGAC